jgi:hypothetical protein
VVTFRVIASKRVVFLASPPGVSADCPNTRPKRAPTQIRRRDAFLTPQLATSVS